MFSRLFARIRRLARIIQVYSNPHHVLLDRLEVIRNPVVIQIRGGARYKVRPRCEVKTDIDTINETWVDRVYDWVLERYLHPHSLVIDIGANIGAFSIKVANLVPSATVYAYEPEISNFSLLLENIRLNGVQGRVKGYQIAVSGQSGTRRLFLSEGSSGTHSFFRDRLEKHQLRPSQGHMVSCTTLEEILNLQQLPHCDVLKIDCEGAEYEVLLSTPRECLVRIKSIAMELHDIEATPESELYEFLQSVGFRLFRPKLERAGMLYAVRE